MLFLFKGGIAIDAQKFRAACDKILYEERKQNGIGTLKEKTLHKILKFYFEPHEHNHETKVGGYVADIVGETGIVEIQTRQFSKMRKKLEAFLPVCDVTVVYPVAQVKYLCWLDGETGEVSNKRKSPRQGRPYEIFDELYSIKYLLKEPKLHFCIVMLGMEECRNLNGWGKDKKRGSSRFDRVPTQIFEEILIGGTEDYHKLIPDDLPEEFSTKDFKKHGGLSQKGAQTALNVLHYVEAVTKIGKKGNLILYKRNKNSLQI